MQKNPQQKNPQWKKPQNSTAFQGNAPARTGGGGPFGQVDQVSDDLLRNVPPHSVEAEQAVLGGVFYADRYSTRWLISLMKTTFIFPLTRPSLNLFPSCTAATHPLISSR